MQRLRGDDGAVAVVVALLLTALLGVGALVLDTGSLYAERRQVQNGADAAALAAVLDCATPAGCASTAAGTASVKANQNANDLLTAVASVSGPAVCGSGGGLPACNPASGLGPWDCLPPAGPLAANYVQVRTQTDRTGVDPTLMPPILARALPGNAGYPGSTVRACARASWGGPSGITSGLALTISHCEWALATSGGTSFAPAPPYPPNPPTSVERVLRLHTNVTQPCPTAGHNSSDRPGAFGWLDEDNNDCKSTVDINTPEYGTDPGNNVSNSCKAALDLATAQPYPIIHMPVYRSVTGSGNNTEYQLEGFGAFVVTGAKLPGYNNPSWLYPSNPDRCTGGNEKCIYGFFTQALVPASGTIGGPSMGVNVVQMSG